MSQSGLRGPKMIPNDQYNMFLTIWGHFGPIWTLFGHFTQNLSFCSKSLWPRSTLCFLGKKSGFVWNDKKCSKWSQNGPKWSKTCYIDHFGIILGPLRPLWDIGKPAMFSHFWPQKGHFEPLCAHDWRMAMAKTASNQLGICIRTMHVRRMPKVSIIMAVTTKIVTQKWPKMSRFWQKSRNNGRVRAREVCFYQCLRVTKF